MDMEIGELWDLVNKYVDWLMAGILFLGVLNIGFAFFLITSFLGQPGFYEKYDKVDPIDPLVRKQQKLQEIPTMNEIDIEEPEKGRALPKRYAKLKNTSLFVPFDRRFEPGEDETETTGPVRLPKIQGYQIVGRVTTPGQQKVTLLKRTRDGKTFVAKEGEYLPNTDIKVKTVSDTMVALTQPEHRLTKYQFETDEIKQRLRKFIKFQ